MIPLRDSVKSKTLPVVNIIFIVVNALFFFFELSLGSNLNAFISQFGLTPTQFVADASSAPPNIFGMIIPLFTAMFLHGGWMHFIGNMWFLWIFGDNVEDSMGHLRYFFFYLLVGIGAGIAHLLFNLHSAVPTIGASGAISGVMGAYLVLYPRGRVTTFILIFIFFRIIEIPAYVFLLFWIGFQAVLGMASLAEAQGSGGIAWWAHIGGFVLGVVLIFLFKKRKLSEIKSEYTSNDRRTGF